MFQKKKLPAKEAELTRPEDGYSSADQNTGSGKASQEDDRVRLCCDISRELHKKLRFHAVTHDTAIYRVIERLIDEHCAA
jgi:hypothetical protein